jgi:hypothetical protein
MARNALSRALAARHIILPRAAAYVSSRSTSTSAMYGMLALSNRNETQYFSKLSRLPLMEHSPTLKLLYTSEVEVGSSSALASSLSAKSQQQQVDGSIGQPRIPMPQELRNETEASPWAEHRREVARLDFRSYTWEIERLQSRLRLRSSVLARLLHRKLIAEDRMRLDSRKKELAKLRNTIEKAEKDGWEAKSDQLPKHQYFKDLSDDFQSSSRDASQARNVLYSLAVIASGAYLHSLYAEGKIGSKTEDSLTDTIQTVQYGGKMLTEEELDQNVQTPPQPPDTLGQSVESESKHISTPSHCDCNRVANPIIAEQSLMDEQLDSTSIVPKLVTTDQAPRREKQNPASSWRSLLWKKE